MRIRKLSALLVIATWIIVAVSGCNNSNKVKNLNETQAIQTTTELTQTTTESTESTVTQISSEKVIEEIPSQISQEVNVNPDSNNTTNNTTNNNSEAPNIETEAKVNPDFVAKLKISNSVNQMIVVAASGSNATVSMHEIQNDEWTQIMSTQGYVGIDGVDKAKNVNESTHITPTGIYTLSIAFGVKDNPGTTLPYTKVDDSNYWVDDPASKYYNTFVSTSDPKVVPDWNSAEHLNAYLTSIPYAYAIAIDYNLDCIPNAGSAIFLHCSNKGGTYGCVSIPADEMIFVLQHIHSGCVIVIDTENGIYKY